MNREYHRREYPLFLRVMLAIGVLFLGALGLLLGSMIMSMIGFAYGMPNVIAATVIAEQVGILLLGLSVVLGGGVSMLGLLVGDTSQHRSDAQDKLKNEERMFDIREQGLTVEDVLADMSMTEREQLAEQLAMSRLAIREDGVLIPLEQAENLQKIERYIDR